ncbi:MAG: nitrite/sulfite reductase, partial [bacterium]|nr:nitrite/sulfite reductase [bacterium]
MQIVKLPEMLEEDLNKFRTETERFRNGSMSSEEFRSFHVTQGVYEQREEGTFMLRVRCPAGCVLPHQMRTLARVARKYGNGVLHVTTRQDIQVHRVLLDSVHPALVELFSAGLSTKGGGGNTVRNITACYDAGVCAREAFNVAPCAVALTEFLLSEPRSYALPRKYKIALSGCSRDCAGATVNDVGFIARRRGDELGFAVYVGGGMGAHSRVADLLEEFVPAGGVHLIAEAVKRVFDKHGNRKDRQRARLRFLIEQIGFGRFRQLYEAELSELRTAGLSPPQVRELPWNNNTRVAELGERPDERFPEWRDKNVVPQKQEGYYLVHVPLPLGDVPADSLERLADVVEVLGEG